MGSGDVPEMGSDDGPEMDSGNGPEEQERRNIRETDNRTVTESLTAKGSPLAARMRHLADTRIQYERQGGIKRTALARAKFHTESHG